MENGPKFREEDTQKPSGEDKEKREILALTANKEELEEAADLVVREYQKKGYLNPQEYVSSKEKILDSLRLESSRTFIVKYENKVVGTLSVVLDSAKGLPMDEFYKEEVNILRRDGGKIAEITKLAIRSDHRKFNLLQSLFTVAFKYGLSENLDYYCIAINPRQESNYKAVYFERIGEEKVYHSLEGAPVIAMSLSFSKAKEILIDEGLKGTFRKGIIRDVFQFL